MAGFTHLTGGRMTAKFAGCNVAIMTANAGVIGLTVINGLSEGIPARPGDVTTVADIGA